jgi:hypothetical protein
MKFQERMQAILEFCKQPKSSEQIKDKFNITHQATYRCIRILKAGGNLQKINIKGKPNGHGVTFLTTDKPYHVPTKPKWNTGFTILGVRL